MDASTARTAFHDYASCIERYFVPYFGERQLEELTHIDIREFELWRDRQLKRTPKASTLNNFTSAWNRVIATAVQQCYISERVPVPKLSNKGQKSQPRPAFNKDEIAQLLEFMQQWQQGGRSGSEREMRCLLCDYVEMLLYTGMRHGTEAMNIRWQHLEWHNRDGVRYLRVWVSGKTGGRWLIARHSAVVGRTIRRIRRTARSALLGRLDQRDLSGRRSIPTLPSRGGGQRWSTRRASWMPSRSGRRTEARPQLTPWRRGAPVG
jgi:integrase